MLTLKVHLQLSPLLGAADSHVKLHKKLYTWILTVSFHFWCSDKTPWQKNSLGAEGVYCNSAESTIVRKSRKELKTASHCQKQGNKCILACVLTCLPLARRLHSQTVQDPGCCSQWTGSSHIKINFKKISLGDCEAIQWSDELVILPEDPGMTPRPTWQITTVCNLSSRNFNALFWPPWQQRGLFMQAKHLDI